MPQCAADLDLRSKRKVKKEMGCPFCLSPLRLARQLRTRCGQAVPTIVRDQAGLTHVAVPLSLGNHRLGAIIAGQVFDQYPDSLLLQRTAKKFGVSAQSLWNLSSKQRPCKPRHLANGRRFVVYARPGVFAATLWCNPRDPSGAGEPSVSIVSRGRDGLCTFYDRFIWDV